MAMSRLINSSSSHHSKIPRIIIQTNEYRVHGKSKKKGKNFKYSRPLLINMVLRGGEIA